MISELSTAIILYTGKTKTLTVAVYTEVVREITERLQLCLPYSLL